MPVHGKIYHYEYLRTMENSKKPENSHLCIENDTYGIYFVDSADQTIIRKTIDEGVTVSEVHNDSLTIISMWHDRANNFIYFFAVLTSYGGGGSNYVKKIDLTDSDAISTVITITNDNVGDEKTHYMGRDVIIDGGTVKGLVTAYHEWIDPDPEPHIVSEYLIEIYNTTAGGTREGTHTALALDNIGFGVEDVSGNWYWSGKRSIANSVLIKWTGGNNFSSTGDVAGYELETTNKSLWGIAYDGSNLLFFVFKKTSDSKYYLMTYSISGDSTTASDYEYNVSLMLDRNSDSSGTAPFNSERGFHLTDYYVYQILRNRGGVWKIADLNHADTPPTDVIIAITDKYLIINDAKLYEYKNFM